MDYRTDFFDTYLNSSTADKILNLFRLRKKIVSVIELSNPDVLHFHVTHNFSWWRSLLLIRIALSRKIPCVISIHSGKFDKFCKQYFSIPGKIFATLSKKTLVQFVVLEDRWIRSLSDFANGLVCIRNPVEIGDSSRRESKRGNCIKLLLIARSDKIKGHFFAVEVLRHVRKLGFEAELEMTGVKAGFYVPSDLKITTHEWLDDQEDVRKKIEIADFVLSPSEYEGSSMSVLEAMALGTIPIVSEVSSETVSVEELVVDGLNPEDWANAIIKIMSKKQKKEMTNKINLVIKRHDINEISRQWGERYDIFLESISDDCD